MSYTGKRILKSKTMIYNRYFHELLAKLVDYAPAFCVHALEDFLAKKDIQDFKDIKKLVHALEEIVPMSASEYKYNIDILIKLIYRADAELADDIIDEFLSVLKDEYGASDFNSVQYMDRREVVRRLAEIYTGLVRFKMLQKQEKQEGVANNATPSAKANSEELF